MIAAVLILLTAAIVIAIRESLVEKTGHFTPAYIKEDIGELLKNGLEDELYQTLLLQTGLGRDAIDGILADNPDYMKKLQMHQDNFFTENNYVCNRITIITGEEQSVDEEGQVTEKFQIENLQDGDILLAFSTHSIGWRHGHSALVLDGESGKTLEAVVLGRNSEVQNVQKWQRYPTFVQLRLKDEALLELEMDRDEAISEMIAIAQEKLTGIPYGLLTGIPFKYVEDIKKTQCAHLVWYAYKEMGLDIDSDGGWLVTPNDMGGSEYFEIVQIYGLNPMDYMGK